MKYEHADNTKHYFSAFHFKSSTFKFRRSCRQKFPQRNTGMFGISNDSYHTSHTSHHSVTFSGNKLFLTHYIQVLQHVFKIFLKEKEEL